MLNSSPVSNSQHFVFGHLFIAQYKFTVAVMHMNAYYIHIYNTIYAAVPKNWVVRVSRVQVPDIALYIHMYFIIHVYSCMYTYVCGYVATVHAYVQYLTYL